MILSGLLATTTAKLAVGGILAASAAGAAGVAVAHHSDPKSPADQLKTIVEDCKDTVRPAQHGIGECVSEQARKHGLKDPAAEASKQHHEDAQDGTSKHVEKLETPEAKPDTELENDGKHNDSVGGSSGGEHGNLGHHDGTATGAPPAPNPHHETETPGAEPEHGGTSPDGHHDGGTSDHSGSGSGH